MYNCNDFSSGDKVTIDPKSPINSDDNGNLYSFLEGLLNVELTILRVMPIVDLLKVTRGNGKSFLLYPARVKPYSERATHIQKNYKV